MKNDENGSHADLYVYFYHPDYTVGTGFKPVLHLLAGLSTLSLHRRWGITPRPEVVLIIVTPLPVCQVIRYWKNGRNTVY